MTLVSKTLAPNGQLVDPRTGLATPPFNRYLNSITILANTAAGGTLTTALGSGLQGGGDLATNLSISIAPNGVTNAMLRQSAPYSVIGRQFGTIGNAADITADADNRVLARIGGVLAFTDVALIPAVVADGDYGDITVSGTGTVWTIDANVVGNTKLAQVPTATFKGRTTAGTGNSEDLTATQATALLNAFSSTLKGLAPASGGGTANYLRADGTWAAPPGATSGTVTTVSVVTANGVSGSVANPTTTPAITLTLGAITPSTVGIASGVPATVFKLVNGTGAADTRALFYNSSTYSIALTNNTGNGNVYLGASPAAAPSLIISNNAGTQIAEITDAGLLTTTGGADITGRVTATTYLKSGVYTVATLPAAGTAGAGARACVTDALAPVFLGIIVGGGAIFTGVICDGTNWRAD